jgi:hypothetical protein
VERREKVRLKGDERKGKEREGQGRTRSIRGKGRSSKRREEKARQKKGRDHTLQVQRTMKDFMADSRKSAEDAEEGEGAEETSRAGEVAHSSSEGEGGKQEDSGDGGSESASEQAIDPCNGVCPKTGATTPSEPQIVVYSLERGGHPLAVNQRMSPPMPIPPYYVARVYSDEEDAREEVILEDAEKPPAPNKCGKPTQDGEQDGKVKNRAGQQRAGSVTPDASSHDAEKEEMRHGAAERRGAETMVEFAHLQQNTQGKVAKPSKAAAEANLIDPRTGMVYATFPWKNHYQFRKKSPDQISAFCEVQTIYV